MANPEDQEKYETFQLLGIEPHHAARYVQAEAIRENMPTPTNSPATIYTVLQVKEQFLQQTEQLTQGI